MARARILVVEDEAIIAMDIQSGLERVGYTVTGVASSGEEAIQRASATHPDLVLMDIALEGDMDGVEAAGELRRRFDIPVVYLSAFVNDSILERAKHTEPAGYIVKPFDERAVHATIEMALHRRSKELLRGRARGIVPRISEL